MDVNGLHELNNMKGHPAGDVMLRFIAEQMRECFGEEHTYRIGGDEFVAFLLDQDTEAVIAKLDKLNESIEKKQYHVAIGYDIVDKENLNMNALIRAAETKMYQSKSQFYKDGGRERRK